VKEFFDGDDGRHYIFTTTTVVAWTYQGGKVVRSEEKARDSSADAMAAGVSADGMVWISHTIEMSWFTRDGQAIGTSSVENAWLEFTAGMDASNTIYMCGRTPRSGFGNTQPYCTAFTPGGSDPLWAVEIGDKGDVVKGVMLVGDALYVTTDMGFLYMLKDVEPVD